jgi:inner membrane protein involved in colicin E2 resistance
MLIIFGLAAMLLLGVTFVVIVIPIMLIRASLRARQNHRSTAASAAASNDDTFATIVAREWPDEAVH